jgi:hypothetical protein
MMSDPEKIFGEFRPDMENLRRGVLTLAQQFYADALDERTQQNGRRSRFHGSYIIHAVQEATPLLTSRLQLVQPQSLSVPELVSNVKELFLYFPSDKGTFEYPDGSPKLIFTRTVFEDGNQHLAAISRQQAQPYEPGDKLVIPYEFIEVGAADDDIKGMYVERPYSDSEFDDEVRRFFGDEAAPAEDSQWDEINLLANLELILQHFELKRQTKDSLQ